MCYLLVCFYVLLEYKEKRETTKNKTSDWHYQTLRLPDSLRSERRQNFCHQPGKANTAYSDHHFYYLNIKYVLKRSSMTKTVSRLSLGRRYSKQRSRSSGNLSIRRYSTDVASYSETVGRRLSQGASNSPPDFNTRKQLIRRSSGNPSPADSSRMSIFSASELIGAKLSNNNLYVENDLPRSPNLLSPGVFFRYNSFIKLYKWSNSYNWLYLKYFMVLKKLLYLV